MVFHYKLSSMHALPSAVALIIAHCTLYFLYCAILVSCSTEAPPEGAAISNRDSLPVMTTYGCSKLISDSGVMRYKVIAEEWQVFDKTDPPRQVFPKGLFLERFNEHHTVDLHITADTAYWYNQNLWELRGRVYVENLADKTTFATSILFWDMGRHEFYSDAYMKVTTATQQLEGDHFRADEAMTHYEVKRSKGFTPMPKDTDTPPARTDSV